MVKEETDAEEFRERIQVEQGNDYRLNSELYINFFSIQSDVEHASDCDME